MADKPIDPKNPVINPAALNPDAGKPQAAEPNGGDLRYLVPDVSMAPGWKPPPSFNTDPPKDKGGGAGELKPGDGKAFSVDLGSLRTGEKTMLASLDTEINQYESLRAKAMAAVNNPTFFGPKEEHGDHTVQNVHSGLPADTPDRGEEANNQIAEMGSQYAAQANPAQEKLLKSIGDTLELAGTFIAMLNKAGQAYSKTDRGAKFPDPPGGSPVT